MQASDVAARRSVTLRHMPRAESDLLDPVDGHGVGPLADIACCHPATAYPLGHGRRVTVDVACGESDEERAEEPEPDADTHDPSDEGKPEPLSGATYEHRPPVEDDDAGHAAEADRTPEGEVEVPHPLAGLEATHGVALLNGPAHEHGLAPAGSDEEGCEEHEVCQV